MLGAAQEVEEQFPNCIIDAEESRQVWKLPALVQEFDGKGLLYDTVVVALGANGSFWRTPAAKVLQYHRIQQRIYWVSPYGRNLYWNEVPFDI